ncbi:hypothetical protein AK830_g11754 [Neonectria ditissima]|uniref:Uncharacterized protein n=1 Tax=Neonectria ditissima TaxID=78410 RepID=A0A0P7B744_9HYPO|nr:hypothetical protein AK830_g11754 [Neonectria ditissima]
MASRSQQTAGSDGRASGPKIGTKRKNVADEPQPAKRPQSTQIMRAGEETEKPSWLSEDYPLNDILALKIRSEIVRKNTELLHKALQLGKKSNELSFDRNTLTVKWVGMTDAVEACNPASRARMSDVYWNWKRISSVRLEYIQVMNMIDLLPDVKPPEWENVAKELLSFPTDILSDGFLQTLKRLEDVIISPLKNLAARTQDDDWAPTKDEELTCTRTVPLTLLLATGDVASGSVSSTNLESSWE